MEKLVQLNRETDTVEEDRLAREAFYVGSSYLVFGLLVLGLVMCEFVIVLALIVNC